MMDLDTLIKCKDDAQLLHDLKLYNDEIGMVEFIEKEDILPLDKNYTKIGNFELDILAIRNSDNVIVMIDHDSPDFEMGNCAKDIRSFLSALRSYIEFMEKCESNEELYDDYEMMDKVANQSALIAGDQTYSWFYKMMFGI